MSSTIITRPETQPRGVSASQSTRTEFPIGRPQAGLLLVAYGALVGFGALLGTLITGSSGGAHPAFDLDVSRRIVELRTPLLNTLSNIGSGLSDTITVVIALAVLSGLFMVMWRRWDEIALLTTALLLEVTSFVSIAYVVGRSRPPVEALDPAPPTSGFPSGHTAAAVALYFGLAIVISAHTDRRWVRLASFLAASLFVVAVALSRMYRGMHFLTDVSVGAALGAACLAAAWLVVRKRIHAATDESHEL